MITLKKQLLKVANKIDNFAGEVENIKNNGNYSQSYKKEKLQEKEQEFKDFTKDKFEKAENKLNKQAEKARKKLEDLQSGNYDKRQYQYTKAVNEIKNYDNPSEYLQNKQETASNEIELQEARKVTLSKARAEGKGTFESLKEQVINTMSKEEKEARKDLAKVELRKSDLEGARNSLNYDLDSIKNGNIETAKTSLIAYADKENLDRKAKKKIASTIN